MSYRYRDSGTDSPWYDKNGNSSKGQVNVRVVGLNMQEGVTNISPSPSSSSLTSFFSSPKKKLNFSVNFNIEVKNISYKHSWIISKSYSQIKKFATELYFDNSLGRNRDMLQCRIPPLSSDMEDINMLIELREGVELFFQEIVSFLDYEIYNPLAEMLNWKEEMGPLINARKIIIRAFRKYLTKKNRESNKYLLLLQHYSPEIMHTSTLLESGIAVFDFFTATIEANKESDIDSPNNNTTFENNNIESDDKDSSVKDADVLVTQNAQNSPEVSHLDEKQSIERNSSSKRRLSARLSVAESLSRRNSRSSSFIGSSSNLGKIFERMSSSAEKRGSYSKGITEAGNNSTPLQNSNGMPQEKILWLDICLDDPALSRLCLNTVDIFMLDPNIFEDIRLAHGLFLSDIAEVRYGCHTDTFMNATEECSLMIKPNKCLSIIGSERVLDLQLEDENMIACDLLVDVLNLLSINSVSTQENLLRRKRFRPTKTYSELRLVDKNEIYMNKKSITIAKNTAKVLRNGIDVEIEQYAAEHGGTRVSTGMLRHVVEENALHITSKGNLKSNWGLSRFLGNQRKRANSFNFDVEIEDTTTSNSSNDNVSSRTPIKIEQDDIWMFIDDIAEIRPGKMSDSIDQSLDLKIITFVCSEGIISLPMPSIEIRDMMLRRFNCFLAFYRRGNKFFYKNLDYLFLNLFVSKRLEEENGKNTEEILGKNTSQNSVSLRKSVKSKKRNKSMYNSSIRSVSSSRENSFSSERWSGRSSASVQ